MAGVDPESSPRVSWSLRPATLGEPGEIHNWTELLYFFNHTLPECHVELSENTKRVALFVLYLAVFSCRFAHYCYFVSMYSSVFFLVCLSVDRYVTLTGASPSWQRHQHRGRRAVCAAVWVLSALVPLPEVVHIRLVDGFEPMCLFVAPFETYSTWALVVSLSTTILGFLLPFPLIAVFNGRRHCLLLCAYIAVFAICWLPYHVTLLLITLHGTHISLHCYLAHLLYFFYDIIDCFSMLHCVVNPILYNFLSPGFQDRLLKAVVHYLPKAQAREGRRASSSSSSSSSTQHSIIITKEGIHPPAAGPHLHPSLNFQAPNTPPTSAPQSLIAS
ncbi:G protein-coupled receptor 182 [Camelus ferus]|nr:G protein-coupled receptor 182 [Camelus ferus]